MPLPPFPPALRHGTLRSKQRDQGLAAPSGLRRAEPERRRMLRNRLSGFGRLGFPWLPLARVQRQAQLRTAWRVPDGATFFLPQVSSASFTAQRRLPSHVRWSAIQHSARNYAQRKKNALSGSRPQCCIMCLCRRMFLISRPPSVSLRVGLQPIRVFLSPCSRPRTRPPQGGSAMMRAQATPVLAGGLSRGRSLRHLSEAAGDQFAAAGHR